MKTKTTKEKKEFSKFKEKYKPTSVEYATVCDTAEEFDLFTDFLSAMTKLKRKNKKP
jgi:hypothetical protein